MKKLTLLLAALSAAAILTACGGGGGGGGTTANVAAADTPVAINASNGAAVTGAVANKSFAYSSGVPDFGTTGTPTSVTFGASNDFAIAAGTKKASGTMAFGSCKFQVTQSDFTSGPLAVGNTVTISACQLSVLTKGTVADGQPKTEEVELVLNGANSQIVTVTVTIQPSGTITIGSTQIGTVTVTPVTGG